MPDEVTCSTSTPERTTTGYGYTRSGGVATSRIVGKNPSTPLLPGRPLVVPVRP